MGNDVELRFDLFCAQAKRHVTQRGDQSLESTPACLRRQNPLKLRCPLDSLVLRQLFLFHELRQDEILDEALVVKKLLKLVGEFVSEKLSTVDEVPPNLSIFEPSRHCVNYR